MKILLTGGSSGIGAAIKNSLGNRYEIDSPNRALLDLSRYPQWPLHDYDALVLCAGSDLGGKTMFEDMQDCHWQNTMQVNLLSNMKLIKDFVKSRSQQWSKIIVIGSTATDHAWPGMLPYTISKIGLEQFCHGLRQEINRNIGISVIRPGLVKTNFNLARHQGRISQQESDQWYASMPHLQADDLVSVVDHILQDRAHMLREITVSL
jgi:NADP-dependent 3-hydroxy acid dehydrogenase YdfG